MASGIFTRAWSQDMGILPDDKPCSSGGGSKTQRFFGKGIATPAHALCAICQQSNGRMLVSYFYCCITIVK